MYLVCHFCRKVAWAPIKLIIFFEMGLCIKKQTCSRKSMDAWSSLTKVIGDCWGVQAGRWWWWSWVVVGNWGWMVGGSRWFVVDSVWVISFIEVLIRRAQKSLEIRAKYVARKIARFDAGAVVVANALSGRCWCCFHWWLWGCGGVCANPSRLQPWANLG